ncbi:type II toxin-antitoxin system RelE/ParE family toxin [Bradyrhizobium sp.]|uniref:type II toxin-antitoxin system RelE/ParE family toxin n=1 Tax=Bradyrhizobium sp. TaxID=376 RepID=UPI003C733293
MKVRYTRRALRQMTEVLDYIDARSPSGAENVKRRLHGIIDLLADHPNSGRITNKGNLRRFVVSPYPYVIFYRTDATGIVIHGVRHAARRPL